MPNVPDPADSGTDRAKSGWKRHPLAMWFFLSLGAGRIILTGIGLVLFGRKRG